MGGPQAPYPLLLLFTLSSVSHSTLVPRVLRIGLLALLTLACWTRPVAAQGEPGDLRQPDDLRVHWAVAFGPALEVATAGDREGERGVLLAPSVGVRLASWFEYVVEAHASRYFTPTGGTVAGVVPVGWRIHGGGRTQPYVSMGAGIVWADFTNLRGIDRRRNYITQIGAGVRRMRADGSALFVEARLFHLSNLSSAPPNLGMEVFTVLVGYRR